MSPVRGEDNLTKLRSWILDMAKKGTAGTGDALREARYAHDLLESLLHQQEKEAP